VAAGDPVSIDVTLRVIDRDETVVGEVECESLTWNFGAGADTPDLSATVSVLEDDLAADPDLFDDRLVQLVYSVDGGAATPVGPLMLVTSDDLILVGGDDQSASEVVRVTAKSGLLLLNEWRITPVGGVHLRRSPREIIVGWPMPAFDHSAWPAMLMIDPDDLTAPTYHDGTISEADVSGTVWAEFLADGWETFEDDSTRIYPPYSSVDPATLSAGQEAALYAAEWELVSGDLERPAGNPTAGDAKYGMPEGWPDKARRAQWVRGDGTGDLTLAYLGSFTVDSLRGKSKRKIMIGSSADEEHQLILYADGYGGIVIDESDQETGYTHWQAWAEVVPADVEYKLYATMTTVDTPGGDGNDSLRFFVSTVNGAGEPDEILLMSNAGNTAMKALRQDKDDPRPGLPIGKAARLVKDWIEAFITPADASVNLVTRTFTDTADSNAVDWDEALNVERTLRVGDSYAAFIDSLSDLVDAELVYSSGIKVALYQQRGADLSATVALKLGGPDGDGSLLRYEARRRPRTMTRAAFVTDDGMGTRINTTLETTVPARASFVESLDATSRGEGRALVNRMITEDGRRQTFPATIAAVEGAVPGVDFDWGDSVTAPDRDSDPSTRQVMTWGGSREGSNEPTFFAELI
jgi:hypothetical protein